MDIKKPTAPAVGHCLSMRSGELVAPRVLHLSNLTVVPIGLSRSADSLGAACSTNQDCLRTARDTRMSAVSGVSAVSLICGRASSSSASGASISAFASLRRKSVLCGVISPSTAICISARILSVSAVAALSLNPRTPTDATLAAGSTSAPGTSEDRNIEGFVSSIHPEVDVAWLASSAPWAAVAPVKIRDHHRWPQTSTTGSPDATLPTISRRARDGHIVALEREGDLTPFSTISALATVARDTGLNNAVRKTNATLAAGSAVPAVPGN